MSRDISFKFNSSYFKFNHTQSCSWMEMNELYYDPPEYSMFLMIYLRILAKADLKCQRIPDNGNSNCILKNNS